MAKQKTASLEELSDLCTPWCIHTVATLRIADHIAAGIDEIDDLAKAAECDAYVLHNVLGHLVDKGVFEEPVPGRFALNEVSNGLLGASVFLGLNGIVGRMAYSWATLPTYVRTGKSAYHEQFGLPFWDDLAANPEIGESFDILMGPAIHGTPDPYFPITGGWESVRTVVDVGGGTGSMLAEILKKWPQIRGTLVELPGTVARSEEIFKSAGVTERVTTVGQSFFEPLPAGADLYVLKKVLSNWPDRETIAILKRCAEAVDPNGRIVILGGVSPDDEPRKLTIEMVLLGGKTNTLSEFREIALDAGLEVTNSGRQASGHFFVECRPI